MAAPIQRAKMEEMSKSKAKECIKQLKDRTKAILNDRKNANQLIDVIVCCEVTNLGVYNNRRIIRFPASYVLSTTQNCLVWALA